jgi:hypothetical protein
LKPMANETSGDFGTLDAFADVGWNTFHHSDAQHICIEAGDFLFYFQLRCVSGVNPLKWIKKLKLFILFKWMAEPLQCSQILMVLRVNSEVMGICFASPCAIH